MLNNPKVGSGYRGFSPPRTRHPCILSQPQSSQTFILSSVQGPSLVARMAGLAALTDDEKSELKEQFTVLDCQESGYINLTELKEALDLAGFKVKLFCFCN